MPVPQLVPSASRRRAALAAAILACAIGGACTLNPQPLPPESGFGNGGPSNDVNPDASLADGGASFQPADAAGPGEAGKREDGGGGGATGDDGGQTTPVGDAAADGSEADAMSDAPSEANPGDAGEEG